MMDIYKNSKLKIFAVEERMSQSTAAWEKYVNPSEGASMADKYEDMKMKRVEGSDNSFIGMRKTLISNSFMSRKFLEMNNERDDLWRIDISHYGYKAIEQIERSERKQKAESWL